VKANVFWDWVIFISLSIIWGSSFVLMKEGLKGLSFTQVASLRIVTAGLVLLPITIRYILTIPRNKLLTVILSGLLGSLIPAYLFCAAETGISSSAAGVLNSLTPVFVILFGILFFKHKIPAIKILGMCIAFAGSILLYFSRADNDDGSKFIMVLLVIIATMCYGANVNLVNKYLLKIPSLQIVAIALTCCSIPALAVLYFSGFFKLDLLSPVVGSSIVFSSILGIIGTALASFLFYMLLKRAGTVFASMVTYAMPVVALLLGMWYGETINLLQVLSMVVILSGVFITHKKTNNKSI
jgi:drug/metabolite transporter (DMT)-like permease